MESRLSFQKQKALLHSLLVLATMVIACKAECTIEKRVMLPNQKDDECTDAEGRKHFINIPWKKECLWCFCDKKSVTCCSNNAKPASYDKEKCEEHFYPENCTYRVVERKNPGKTCGVDKWKM
ncbi:beta-microseminoprotein-like isoform X2 [Apodemus sylvaticus]|uniref:beta-microseminoprotein-like isoform X2 n=1 Tax=Apodemus sylvaticus TaxID=10129 RepID=UPI0022433722|nr:beta-microseminoprotein-like isoform X2 [Apodemus sylvaticus]